MAEPLREQASDSVIAALHVAAASGDQAGALASAIRLAFMDGFTAGALVSAFVCLLGSLAALLFLPAHAKPTSILFGVAEAVAPDEPTTPKASAPVEVPVEWSVSNGKSAETLVPTAHSTEKTPTYF